MTKGRGRNEGTIRKRADGRWEARLNLARVGGKRVRKSFFGKTREEAAEKLAAHTAQRNAGIPVAHGNGTASEFLTGWLEQCRATVAPRTYESYELYIRRHAIPEIGRIRLAALRPEHLRTLLSRKLKSETNPTGELSPRSVTHLRTILATAFKQAVDDRLIPWNPVSATKRPKAAQHQYITLSREHARKFLAAAQESRFEAVFAVALAVGLRLGELRGLRWSDVDLDAKTLRVQQTIQRLRASIAGKSGYIAGKPKSERSKRTLVIPSALIATLRKHRTRQAEAKLRSGREWQDLDLVFCNRTAGPIDAKVLRADFHAVLKRAELPAMRLHDLRHSAASLLLEQGVSLRAVMELLGHSTITLTANTYGHVSREMLADAASRMDSVLGLEQ